MLHRLKLCASSCLSQATARALEYSSNIGDPGASSLPYLSRPALLSQGERAFYEVLRRAMGGRFGISIKPRVADLLLCPPSLWKSPSGARVAQRHVDFVLYDPVTTEVALAIELDDRSHNRSRARERDAFLNEALYTAGVVLMRVKAASSYDALDLHDAIAAHMNFRPRRHRDAS